MHAIRLAWAGHAATAIAVTRDAKGKLVVAGERSAFLPPPAISRQRSAVSDSDELQRRG
jgi:hypothetical protein